jgi:hypothetical protein
LASAAEVSEDQRKTANTNNSAEAGNRSMKRVHKKNQPMVFAISMPSEESSSESPEERNWTRTFEQALAASDKSLVPLGTERPPEMVGRSILFFYGQDDDEDWVAVW